MIAIRVANENIDLTPGSTIRFEFNSTIFDTEAIQGNYTFPFNVPATDKNIKIFGFANLIENPDKTAEYPCIVLADGVKFSDGKLVITNSTSKNFSGHILVGLSGMAVMDKKLSEIDLGGDRTMGANTTEVINHANAVVLQTYPDAHYTFPPHFNDKFYGDAQANNPDFQNVVNKYNPFTQSFIANTDNGIDPINQNNLVPFPFLMYILQKGFEEEGWTISGDFVNDDEMKQLIIYNTYSLDYKRGIDPTEAHLVGTPPFNLYPDFEKRYPFNDITQGYGNPEGAWNTTTNEYTVQSAGIHHIEANLAATIIHLSLTVSYLYLEIRFDGAAIASKTIVMPSFTGVNFTDQVKISRTMSAGDIGKKITVYIRTNSYNSLFKTIIGNFKTGSLIITNRANNINTYARTLNLQNHVPDMKFSELLNTINKLNLTYSYDFSKKTVYIDYVKKSITNPIIDFTEKASPDYEIVHEERPGYTFNYTFPSSDDLVTNNFSKIDPNKFIGEYAKYADLPTAINDADVAFVINRNKYYTVLTGAWIPLCDNYFDYIVGDGKTMIKPKLSTLFIKGVSLFGVQSLIPEVKENGSSVAFNMSINRPDLRLLFYRGMIAGSGGNLYPYATSTRYNWAGIAIADYELRWDGDYGIYKLFWELWIVPYMKSFIVKKTLHLNIVDLLNININDKKRIKYQTYIIKSMSVSVGENIQPIQAELVKI